MSMRKGNLYVCSYFFIICVLNEPSGAKTYASGINQSIYFLIDIKISSSNRELVVPNPKLILSNYLEV
jgi:hypothetical protein